jgi:hypothetical protein
MTGDYVPTATPHWQAGSLDSDVTKNMSRLDGTATLPENATQSVRFTDQYMMLVPQTFGEEATVVVSYIIDGVHYTQSASLSGTTIAEGQKVCIMLKPTATSVSIQLNACYTIKQLNINIPTDCANWTVTSDDDNITLRSALTDYQEEGFWIKDEDCVTTLEGTQQGLVPIYLFTTENASTDTKSGNLLLTVYGEDKTKLYEEKIYYTQLCPESVVSLPSSYYLEPDYDTNEYSFGFVDSDAWGKSVTFTSESVDLKELATLVSGGVSLSGVTLSSNKVVIDYSKCANYCYYYSIVNPYTISYITAASGPQYVMSTSTASTSLLKTKYAQGVTLVQLLEIEHVFRNYEGISCPTDRSAYDAYLNSAPLIAIKKNSFTLKESTFAGKALQYLQISTNDIKWYLPTQNEILLSTDYNLWLASTSSTNASGDVYYYSSLGNAKDCSRTDTHLVRAVRSK